jgi:hypothetical protein
MKRGRPTHRLAPFLLVIRYVGLLAGILKRIDGMTFHIPHAVKIIFGRFAILMT